MITKWHLYSAFPYALMHFTTLCGGLWPDCIEHFKIAKRNFCRRHQFPKQGQATIPAASCPTLSNKCAGSLTFPADHSSEDAGDGAYGLSSLSEKTRTSNHLQMSSQRQHILLSYNWVNRSAVRRKSSDFFFQRSALKGGRISFCGSGPDAF